MDQGTVELRRLAAHVGSLSGLMCRSDTAEVWIDHEFEDDFVTLGWALDAPLAGSALDQLDPVRLSLREPSAIQQVLSDLGHEDLVLSSGKGRTKDRWELTLGGRLLADGGSAGGQDSVTVVLIPGDPDLGPQSARRAAAGHTPHVGVSDAWQRELAKASQRLGTLRRITMETETATLQVDLTLDFIGVALWVGWWLKGDREGSYLDEIGALEWFGTGEGDDVALESLRLLGREALVLRGTPNRVGGGRWELLLGQESWASSWRVRGPWRDRLTLLPSARG